MAVLSIVTDVIEIVKICQSVAVLINDAKNAPIEYQNSVQSILATEETFQCLKETLQEFTAANMQGSMALLGRLASQVDMARTALKKAEIVLFRRYAAEANPRLWNTWKKWLYWRNTRERFEKCLRDVRDRQNCILALLGVTQIQLGIKACKSIAAVTLDLNDAPRPIGYPGSGGVPQEHVRLRYGLGLDQFLFLDLCPNPRKLQEFLEVVLFANLPGKQHIKKRHYRLYCNPNAHGPKELTEESWSHLVGSGSSILLAFVVGTWRMSCVNFCPACNSENRGEWNMWRDCACGCLYYVAEAGEVSYEPRDGWWGGESKGLKEWQSLCRSNQRQIATDAADSSALQTKEIMEEQDRDMHAQDEDYFRCMVMVYDPIFNFMCRNVFCRCILGAMSLTSSAPRIDIPSTFPCPRHARPGLPLKPEAVLPARDDYENDPYFDSFGGYENFKRIARYLNQGTIAFALVDVDKLCPAQGQNDTTVLDLIDSYADAVLEYRREVLSSLRWLWKLGMKAGFEGRYPELVPDVETWMSHESEAIKRPAELAASVDANNKQSSSLEAQQRPIPFLYKGRLTLEMLQDVRLVKDRYCAWP